MPPSGFGVRQLTWLKRFDYICMESALYKITTCMLYKYMHFTKSFFFKLTCLTFLVNCHNSGVCPGSGCVSHQSLYHDISHSKVYIRSVRLPESEVQTPIIVATKCDMRTALETAIGVISLYSDPYSCTLGTPNVKPLIVTMRL